MKKIILWSLLVLVAGYAAWTVYDLYVRPDGNLRQVYLVPRDAAVVIQTGDPVGDWKRLSGSGSWSALRQAPSFAQVNAQVEVLDALLRENRVLFSLIGRREMLISLHTNRTGSFDFLAIVDLKKAAKLGTIKANVEQIYRLSGFEVTTRRHAGLPIAEARDPQTGDILYTAFVDNHFLASYSPRLLERAIDEREAPTIGLDESFLSLEKAVAGKGLARIYLNYSYLPQFLQLYMAPNAYVEMLCRSMDYAGLYLEATDEKIALAGATNLLEEPDPYVAALIRSGSHKTQAHSILSARTALYANLGFDDVGTFITQLEAALSASDPKAFEEYRAARRRIESYFDISLADHFLGWMDGEIAFTQSEPGLLGRDPELILAIRAVDIGQAKSGMALLEKRIRNRTPVRIRSVEYKGYPVNYIELGGFFRLFFGGMFDKFEKPYYTYIGDYVVFSNRSESILSLIEDLEQQNTLDRQSGFRQASKETQEQSTLLAYIDMERLYSQLRRMASRESWTAIQAHREVLLSFPQWTFQVVGGRQTSMQLVLDHLPYVSEPEEEVAESDSSQVTSEREELSELRRFHVEHFEGNVLREYYPDGQLLSESEVKNGRRNGRYREFYPDGKLKVRGAFSDNEPKGTWRYYTPQERLDRKERY